MIGQGIRGAKQSSDNAGEHFLSPQMEIPFRSLSHTYMHTYVHIHVYVYVSTYFLCV